MADILNTLGSMAPEMRDAFIIICTPLAVAMVGFWIFD